MEYLLVDGKRLEENVKTGISVRAKFPDGHFGTADIYFLTKESLLEWLRSRGGENVWAENVVGVLLGHGTIFK